MYSSPAASRTASPRPGQSTLPPQDAPMDPNIRSMQVKVLYTFDDQNKTNCLARCPLPLKVQTAFLDGSTQIGIIELGTCIQAITAASPELVAKLGQDFTVYAYDYSEYETPLVGQGMLSWILASTSSTPMAPALQSKTMVTGRVCKNVLGLFSDGVKETLEVKLRLVPVPTCLQSEYLESMGKYRDASNLVTENFDTQAWTNFLRENPNFGAPMADEVPLVPHDSNNYNVQDATLHCEQMLSTDDVPTVAPTQTQRPAPPAHNHFVIFGTPEQIAKARPKTPSQRPSRPSSRASNRGRPTLRKSASCTSRVENSRTQDGSDAEEGPSKKRAKITKTDWRGPSAFDSNEESLRVAASTAASIRGHRPMAGLVAAENPVRPPTPRPKSGAQQRKQPSLLRSSTSISHAAMTRHDSTYQSPYADIDSDAVMTSPEAQSASASSTPQDIPSSPPVMRRASPTPSSPQLPMLPNDFDSGFVSGTVDECFDEDDEDRPIDEHDLRMAAKYNQRSNTMTSDVFNEDIPAGVRLALGKALPRPQPRKRTMSAVSSPKPLSEPTPPLPNDQSQSSGIETAPQETPGVIPPGPIKAAKRPRQAGSSANDGTSRPTSPAPSEGPTRARRGSGVGFNKRQRQIRDKLHASIAAGQPPPHCENCGEIDTPTWRRAFVRTEDGPPPDVKPPQPSKPPKASEYEDTDGIVTWEPFDRDESGSVTSHRIFKKSIQPEEMAAFEELRLCNPCGIWLFKNRQMRPIERWSKQLGGEGGSTARSRSRKKPAQSKSTEPQSDWDERQQSELPMPEDVETIPPQSGSSNTNNEIGRPVAPSGPLRTSSVSSQEATASQGSTLDKAAAEAALKKAIQSSPPKFPGSKCSPISLEDEVPKDPTRRLLFPSPRKAGEAKSLDGSPNAVEAGHDQSNKTATAPLVLDPSHSGKENLPPRVSNDAGHHDVDHSDETNPTQTTPSTKRTQNPLQTPASRKTDKVLTTNGFLSSASRRWHNAFDTSPMRSDGLFAAEMTPFTAQLTQLLSEANNNNILNNNQTPSKHRGINSDDMDLPTFGLGSDMEADAGNLFAFSDLSTDDLGIGSVTTGFSSTGVMPSSPSPLGSHHQHIGFEFFEDPAEGL